MSIEKAEQAGHCLAVHRGATCMRRLKRVKRVANDGHGGKTSTRRLECPKHGRAIFTPLSGGK